MPLEPISIIGLGYVGLPLANAFSKKFPVMGFDVNPVRVEEVKSSRDAHRITATSVERKIGDVDVWIIA